MHRCKHINLAWRAFGHRRVHQKLSTHAASTVHAHTLLHTQIRGSLLLPARHTISSAMFAHTGQEKYDYANELCGRGAGECLHPHIHYGCSAGHRVLPLQCPHTSRLYSRCFIMNVIRELIELVARGKCLKSHKSICLGASAENMLAPNCPA